LLWLFGNSALKVSNGKRTRHTKKYETVHDALYCRNESTSICFFYNFSVYFCLFFQCITSSVLFRTDLIANHYHIAVFYYATRETPMDCHLLLQWNFTVVFVSKLFFVVAENFEYNSKFSAFYVVPEGGVFEHVYTGTKVPVLLHFFLCINYCGPLCIIAVQ
jgi:hypothetical protein